MLQRVARELVTCLQDLDSFGVHLGFFQGEIEQTRMNYLSNLEGAAWSLACRWWDQTDDTRETKLEVKRGSKLQSPAQLFESTLFFSNLPFVILSFQILVEAAEAVGKPNLTGQIIRLVHPEPPNFPARGAAPGSTAAPAPEGAAVNGASVRKKAPPVPKKPTFKKYLPPGGQTTAPNAAAASRRDAAWDPRTPPSFATAPAAQTAVNPGGRGPPPPSFATASTSHNSVGVPAPGSSSAPEDRGVPQNSSPEATPDA